MKKNFRIPSLLMSLLTLLLISAANLAPPPTPQAPLGPTTDTTPTYQWTKVTNATSYQYQLVQGTTFVYSQTVQASACNANSCIHTPTKILAINTYRWRIRAMVGGVWQPFSAYKTFWVAGPGVSIVSYNTYPDSLIDSYQYVVGEVYNAGLSPASSIRVSVNFFNNNQLVATDYIRTHVNLFPNQKTCFSIWIKAPTAWNRYAFETPTYYSSASPQPLLKVISSSGSIGSTYTYKILGQARNDDTKPVKYGSVVATLYNSAGRVIGCKSTSLNNNNLGVGQTSSFEVSVYPSSPSAVASYILQTKGSY